MSAMYSAWEIQSYEQQDHDLVSHLTGVRLKIALKVDTYTWIANFSLECMALIDSIFRIAPLTLMDNSKCVLITYSYLF